MAKQDLDLFIKGNVDSLKKALQSAQDEIKQVRNQIKETNRISKESGDSFVESAARAGTAYFALKGVITSTLGAFFESEKAQRQLDQAFARSGLSASKLKDSYSTLADAATNLTGVDDDAAKKAFAKAQVQLGSIEITNDLVTATANLAAVTGQDFGSALDEIIRTSTTTKNTLKAYNVELDKNMSVSARLSAITSQLNGTLAGQAEAAKTGATQFSILKVQIGNLAEDIGAQLAPAAIKAAEGIREMIQWVRAHPELIKFTAGVIAGVGALTAVAGVISTVGSALAILKPIIAAVGAALGAITLPVWAVVAALGALAAGVAYFVLGQKDVAKSSKEAAVEVAELEEQVRNYQRTRDSLKARSDFGSEYVNAGKNLEQAKKKLEEMKIVQEDLLKAERLRDKEAAKTKPLSGDRKANDGDEETPAEKQKKIEEERNRAIREARAQRAEEERQERELEKAERAIALQEDLDQNAEYQALDQEQKLNVRRSLVEDAKLRRLDERTAEEEITKERITAQVKRENDYLITKKKYGTALAEVDRFLNQESIQGAKNTADQLVALTQSKNATLKGIGKAAAVAQIGIDTATGAVAAYKSLAGIPIVGPALGAAAAAALIAFGAERTNQVLAANQGGIVPGGGPDSDSVHSFLTPGELVVPRKSFDEVVNAVAAQRVAQKQPEASVESAPQNNVYITVQGDVLSDQVWIERLAKGLSDALEFGNVRVFGVNT
jgi:hypothetical protein